ncbi:hypothetical protein AB0R12_31020, partial [Streptomyces niveus]
FIGGGRRKSAGDNEELIQWVKDAKATAADDEVPRLLGEAGLRIIDSGDTTLPQTEYLADGTRLDLPARWFVLAPARHA